MAGRWATRIGPHGRLCVNRRDSKACGTSRRTKPFRSKVQLPEIIQPELPCESVQRDRESGTDYRAERNAQLVPCHVSSSQGLHRWPQVVTRMPVHVMMRNLVEAISSRPGPAHVRNTLYGFMQDHGHAPWQQEAHDTDGWSTTDATDDIEILCCSTRYTHNTHRHTVLKFSSRRDSS